MQVLLIGKNKIYKTNLSSEIIGEYWISDNIEMRDLIKIEAINGVWKAISNSYARIINPKYLKIEEELQIIKDEKTFVERASLKEYGMYIIALGSTKNLFILYCLPDKSNDFIHKKIVNTKEITIGNGENCSIVFENVLISELHSKIFFENSKWYVQNFDKRFGTMVNSLQIEDNITELENGDVIFIMGLKLVLINNNLFINNIENQINFKQNVLVQSKIKSRILDLNSFESDDDINLVNCDKYFSRSPRMKEIIEVEKIIIDPPPQSKNSEGKPILLMLGPSIAFGVVSFVTFFTVLYSIIKGNSSISNSITTLLFPFVTLISMLVIPILNFRYEKNNKEKYEAKRQQKYKDYLNKKTEEINKIKHKQLGILAKNYLNIDKCQKVILENNHRLWERRIDDSDFLAIRLGTGDVPLKVDIEYPEDRFEMEDDALLQIFQNIFEITKNINNAPIITSLVDNIITGFIFNNPDQIEAFMKNIILQLVTFQSYEELNLVFLVNDLNNWQYVKMLPHLWNNTKKIRFFADDFSEINEISKYLIDELNIRLQNKKDELTYLPHYLIITNDYKKIEDFGFFTELTKIKQNIGFSLLCITDDFYKLPNECKTFVRIDNDKAILFDSENVKASQIPIKLDEYNDISFKSISQKLSNIPIRIKNKSTYRLPTNYSFLEMYKVGNIKSLNIEDRWKNNDSSLSLKAQIGIDSSQNPIFLDIHEKYHGPHGLIAGATGSGKSEFIMTYILSLAINFHPYDVNFLLIDYKGGGLAGAFEKNDFKLPHLVGVITNIDTEGLQRSLISVQSEVKRRQVLFNEVRNLVNEGTIDIYKYQRLYHEGIVKLPIPHLLIICDEFAELKQQRPEFMDELISISRIGRSLGIHLILATQKPAGIVNDQIRSNSKFAVCLKVQDTHDSMDVIKTNDAAFLKNPGQFYLQVGNAEYFVLGQSGWAGAPYVPTKTMKTNLDTSIEFISDIGFSVRKVDDIVSNKENKSSAEQLSSIVKYMCDLAKKENIETKSLWLENISDKIYINELRKKYNYQNNINNINLILGEYDNPSHQSQGLVEYNILDKDNFIVYGNIESGKETLINTFIYDLVTNYGSDVIQFYLMDFGSEALRIFKNFPHVGDVVFVYDNEKIDRLFELLKKEITNRKQLLVNYNGDYNLYLKRGNKLPIIICVLNNYETFEEVYNMKYDDIISSITREGPQYGILFVLSCASSSSIRYRLKQNFAKKIVLQLNKTEEINDIYGKTVRKKIPHIFGRGLISNNKDEIFEFQTARICKVQDYNKHIEELEIKLNKENEIRAVPIPIIPEIITIGELKTYLDGISKVPIGIIKDNFEICSYNFKENFMTVIGSKSVNNAIKFTFNILEEIKELPNNSINVLDAEEVKKNKDITMEDAFKQFMIEMENNNSNSNYEHCLAVIIGINKFISDGNVSENQLNDFFKELSNSGKCSFIIIDNVNLLKRNAFSNWYRNNISLDAGIWVGGGILDQTLINCNVRVERQMNSCDSTFGFYIKEGAPRFIKLLGMKKESIN